MGRVGVTQQACTGVEVGIEERDKTVGLGQVFLGQLVQVMEDLIGGQAAGHLGPEHAP